MRRKTTLNGSWTKRTNSAQDEIKPCMPRLRWVSAQRTRSSWPLSSKGTPSQPSLRAKSLLRNTIYLRGAHTYSLSTHHASAVFWRHQSRRGHGHKLPRLARTPPRPSSSSSAYPDAIKAILAIRPSMVFAGILATRIASSLHRSERASRLAATSSTSGCSPAACQDASNSSLPDDLSQPFRRKRARG